jgi:hypothetical protein
LAVEKIVMATSVNNLDPVGKNTEFDGSVGTASGWIKIKAKTVPATIKHVWYFGDKKYSSSRWISSSTPRAPGAPSR